MQPKLIDDFTDRLLKVIRGAAPFPTFFVPALDSRRSLFRFNFGHPQ